MPEDDDMPEFIMGTPDEVQAKVREMMDRQNMALTAMRHDVQRFFSELSAEQLAILRFLLHQMGQNPEATFFYEGVVSATLMLHHNVCPACGVDHDQEALETFQAEAAAEGAPTPDDPPDDVPATRDDMLKEYNVSDRDATASDTVVICDGCGMEYGSLHERMQSRSGPEGCRGCVEKAKWG